MAINKKLITFDKKSTFLGANGINNVSSPTDGYYHNIPEWSMVFILETGEIWHNGKYFGKPIKDQIFPATSQLTKGIVFMNNDDYYYRSFNLWGNVFDGSVRDINGELVVQGETYKWTYGDSVIRKGNTNLIAFSGLSGVYDVFIPSGDLSVTGGDLKVGNNITLASTGSIKGTHILNTNSYFNLDYSLGKTWNSIKLFNTSGTLISLDSTRPAIINIQAGVYASGTNWQPWITGGDVTELSSWGIGLGGDAFYIGRIDKTNTENSLSQYWKFDSEDGITISGTTKYIKVADLAGASEKIFLADGTVKALSELMSDAVVGEATTTNYGGFKLTQNKSSVQQTLVSNTTGNGRYAVKMNADGTLFVEFVLANTWLPATNTLGGYVPQLSTGSDTIDSNLNDYVLTFTDSSDETIYPTWKRLPSTSFENTWREIKVNGIQKRSTATSSGDLNFINGTNTSVEWTEDNKLKINAVDTWNAFTAATSEAAGTAGYIQAPAGALNKFFRGDNTWLTINLNVTSALYVGASNGTGNSAQSTNGNVYLIFAEGSSYSRYKIVGSGRASVTSDASGNITINSSGYSNFGSATASAAGTSGLVPAPGANVLGTGGYFLRADGSWVVPTNTWKAANNSQEGYVPKLSGNGTIGTQSTEYVLTFTSGGTGTITPTWKLLPANAFVNTWTAWKGATDSANGTAGYMPAPTSAQRGQFLRGDGSWVSLNNYSLPTASKDTLGGVKTGAAITDTTGYTAVAIKDGVIYYKDTNTTYSFSNLLFLQTSGTNLMTYNSQAVRTVLAGSNITFTHSNNVLTIAAKDTTYSTVSKTAAGLCPTLPNETTTTKYLRLDGAWAVPPDNNTWKPANTSLEGYAPKLTTGGGTIGTQSTEYVLTFKSGTDSAPVWRLLPANAYNDHTYTVNNATYSIKSLVGSTTTTLSDFTANQSGNDDFTLVQGSNITFTVDATNRKLTIAGTANTWNAANASQAGYVPKSTANKILRADGKGALYWGDDANTTYTFYNLQFQNSSGTTVDTYKPTTSPTKTLKAGNNVTISAASNVVTIASTNTWNANAVGVAGYVAAPTKAANANMTWLTDANGVPAWRASNNHTHSYLPLSGGTMSLGEGLKFHADENYFGTNLDARIISLLDGNGTTCDGGLIIDERATSNGTTTVTELLRIRHDEFKWKGNTILHSSNSSVSLNGSTLTVKINGTEKSLTNTWRGIQNNLTSSTNTTESLSAKQGYLLANGSARDSTKLPIAQVSVELNTNTTWGKTYAESNRLSFVYNTSGREWAYWIGMRSSDAGYGTILRLSHDGLVLYAHKAGGAAGANWSDWKNIITSDNIGSQSVNYASSAGSVAWGNVSSKPATATRWPSWSEVTDKPSTFAPSSGSSYYMTRDAWHSSGNGDKVDNLICGTSFYYTNHGAPTNGVVAAFSGTHASYQLQIQAQYNGNAFYYRCKNGDNGTWRDWKRLLNSDEAASSVAWSNVTSKPATATRWPAWSEVTSKPTTLSGYGITDGLYSTQVSTAQTDLTYAKNASKTIRRGFVYNTSGTEWSYLFGFTSGTNSSTGYPNYGAVYKFGYTDRYIRVLRVSGSGTWLSTDWEKIYAGYADSAGSVTWGNISSKPSATGGATTPVYWNGSGFTNCTAYSSASVNYATSAGSAGSVPWTGVSSQMQGGNEFNIPDNGYSNTGFWINYYPRNVRSANGTAIANYYFGNLRASYASLNAANYYTSSDRLKKQNISEFSEHIRKFQLKDTKTWHYGVIALEVPEMFRLGEEGNMTVNYNSVLSYYVGSLENSVAGLENAKRLLENRVKMLEDKLKKYEDKFIN